MALKTEMTLFGLDMQAVGRFFRQGWAEAMRFPKLRWLSPDIPIRLLLLNGGASIRQGASAVTLPDTTEVSLTAIEIPSDIVLERGLKIPSQLSEGEVEQAIALEVSAVSPFAENDRVWGWTWNSEQTGVRLVLASQTHIKTFLATQETRIRNSHPEVWFDASAPVVIRGFGESERKKREKLGRRRILLILLGLCVLAVALAASPVLQERQKTFRAQAAVASVEKEAVPFMAQKEELTKLNERIRRINAQYQAKIDAPLILEKLTKILPDDVVLNRVEFAPGGVIRIAGEAPSAPQLLELLGQEPGFQDVRAPSATSRNPGNNKEIFQIELTYKPATPWPALKVSNLPPPEPLPAKSTDPKPVEPVKTVESPKTVEPPKTAPLPTAPTSATPPVGTTPAGTPTLPAPPAQMPPFPGPNSVPTPPVNSGNNVPPATITAPDGSIHPAPPALEPPPVTPAPTTEVTR